MRSEEEEADAKRGVPGAAQTPVRTLRAAVLNDMLLTGVLCVKLYARPVESIGESEQIGAAGTVCSVVGPLVVVQVSPSRLRLHRTFTPE